MASDFNENSWASESPSLLYRLRYVRQHGAYMIDPEIGQYRSSWYYDADVYDVAWTWLAEGYAREQAQEAGYGLAALIDGLWLRAALSGKPLDKTLAQSLTSHFIRQHLPNP